MNSAEIFDSMKTLIGEINITSIEVEVSEGSNPEDPKYVLDQRSKLFSTFGNIKSPSYLRILNNGEVWVMTHVLFNGFLLKDFIEKYEEIDYAFDEAIKREAEFAKIGIGMKSVLPAYTDFIKERYEGVKYDNETSKYKCDFAKVQIDVIDSFKEEHIYSLYHVLSRLFEGSLTRLAKISLPGVSSNLKWNLKAVYLLELIASLIEKKAIVGKEFQVSDIEIFRQFEAFLNIDLGDIYKQLNAAKKRKNEKAVFLVQLVEIFRRIKPEIIKKK